MTPDTVSEPPLITGAQLADFTAAGLNMDDSGVPTTTLAFVDVGTAISGTELIAAVAAAQRSAHVLVGVGTGPIEASRAPLIEALTTTVVAGSDAGAGRTAVMVSNLDAACHQIAVSVAIAPRAATTLAGLLRLTSRTDPFDGLIAESLAYSMLLNGAEFAHWRARRPTRPIREPRDIAVVLERVDDTLTVHLNRPERRNAFGTALRDGLAEALDLALLDPTIDQIRLSGRGPSFCSGGDLDEFGSSGDGATAHLVRLDRSIGARIMRCRQRMDVVVHGACIGAGIEIPAFAARVTARPDTYVQLPELRMGLIPGAGGTVSINARIGRWRTAYLALSALRVDAATALDWGLIDAIDPS